LRSAVERLLADPELRERLGRLARVRARERFGWDAVIDSTLDLYVRAVDSAR
jgi:glycosyltransferase involved in cell wall biosynthesis